MKAIQKISDRSEVANLSAKRILVLSWEMFPLYAGGLGFLAKSAVDEMIRQGSEVVVLVPAAPKGMVIEHTKSLETRTKFYLKKNKPISNLNFDLDNFGQKKVNSTNWPALFSNQKITTNKKFNIYPQNTPAITKAFAWSVLEYVKNNPPFDLIIGMDWETIPSFYLLENYFQCQQKLLKTSNNEQLASCKLDCSILETERTPKKVKKLPKFKSQDLNLLSEKPTSLTSSTNQLKTRPEFYFYINATELDRGPDQINQKENKNAVLDLEKATYKLATKIISISNITRDILVKHYEVDPSRILTVYNDISFEPSSQKFPNIDGGKNVLFIGRLEAQKGLIFLLETAVRVLEIDSQVKFFVAGDGELLPSLVENMCEKGLEKSFFLTGWLGEEDKKKLYASCDLFVMPSPSEPFGLTPLEAIRSDTAVISSQTCGFLSIVPSTPTFAYHDIHNFAQLIIYYLHNSNERSKLLERQKAELAEHSWPKEIAKILDSLAD